MRKHLSLTLFLIAAASQGTIHILSAAIAELPAAYCPEQPYANFNKAKDVECKYYDADQACTNPSCKRYPVIRLLIHARADIDQAPRCSLLFLAKLHGDRQATEALLDAGAIPLIEDAQDKQRPKEFITSNGGKAPSKIFLFELHGVLFDTDYVAAILTGIVYVPLGIPKALYSLLWKHPFNTRAALEAFARITSCQTPRKETWEAIEYISSEIPLYLFSNVTSTSLALLKQKYPTYFQKFTQMLCPGPENNWESKTTSKSLCAQIAPGLTRPAPITLFDNRKEDAEVAARNNWNFQRVSTDEACAQKMYDLTKKEWKKEIISMQSQVHGF